MQNTERSNAALGHLIAFITIAVWGTTYISTKVLLRSFEPIEILIIRFLLGYAFLWLLAPKWIKFNNLKQELILAGAGLSGITLYYLLENIALTYTMASNVGVIITAAPFLTAILMRLIYKKDERLNAGFCVGFVLAVIGIFLISFNGSRLQFNPKGDFLAMLAALAWAVYSVLSKKMTNFGLTVLQATRRIFFYGIIFMLPAIPIFKPDFSAEQFKSPVNTINLIFLSLFASAICFASWNYSVKIIGAVKTSVYIYLTPVVTIVTSVIILNEKFTLLSASGTVLTLIGLILSENIRFKKKVKLI